MSNSIAPGSSADVNVKVTALTTNPNVPVTYKTIILKKNLVNGVNTLTQEMMSVQNIKYVIKYDYVLGEDITIPENCVLEFDGGSISGAHTITGANTCIQAGLVKIFNTNVTLAGSWNVVEAYPEWFGAVGDGVTDDYSAINCVFSFPFKQICLKGTYKLLKTVECSRSNVIITGGGTIDHSETIAHTNVFGNGSFLYVSADNITIDSLNFIGVDIEPNSRDYESSRCIRLIGNNNISVKNCNFSKGNGGAIFASAVNNLKVYICSFYAVNNNSGGGGYGSVHLNSCIDVFVYNCKFNNFSNTGVSITNNDANNIFIKECSFIGNASSTTTMGVWVLSGAYRNINIIDNYFSTIDAEAISIHSQNDNYPIENIIVRGNDIVNIKYIAIAFYTHSKQIKNCIIENNSILRNLPDVNGRACISVEDGSYDCVIKDNVLIGDNKVKGLEVYGTNNITKGNSIRKATTGIELIDRGRGGAINNYIFDCATGISVNYSIHGAIIKNNIISNMSICGINSGMSDTSFKTENYIMNAPSQADGSSIHLISQYTDINDDSKPYYTGTLTNGAASIVFYGVTNKDILLALPMTPGSGILTITSIYQSTVNISSTDTNDSRSFILIKMASIK